MEYEVMLPGEWTRATRLRSNASTPSNFLKRPATGWGISIESQSNRKSTKKQVYISGGVAKED